MKEIKYIILYLIPVPEPDIGTLYLIAPWQISSRILPHGNHKDIGTLYLIAGAWSGVVGTGLRIIIRN
jgi:hypothetical protein